MRNTRRKKRVHLVFTVVMLLALAGNASALPVELPNPGAEKERSDKPGWPAAWGAFTEPGVSARYSRDTTVRRSGKASFHLSVKGKGGGTFMITVPVVPELTYKIAAWVKTKDAKLVRLKVRGKVSSGWVDVRPKYDELKGTMDWTRTVTSVHAPPGLESIVVFLSAKWSGEAWFDEVEIHDNLKEVAERKFRKLTGDLDKMTGSDSLSSLPLEEVKAVKEALSKAREWQKSAARLDPRRAITHEERMAFHNAWLDLEKVRERLTRAFSMSRLPGEFTRVFGVKGPSFLAAWASPMKHVFLRDITSNLRIAKTGRIHAVRGETEAVQLVIVAHQKKLQKVSVSAGDLRSGSLVIPARAVSVKPVAFVKITKKASEKYFPESADYLGWWPDPLLDNFAFDVAKGDTQPLWIAVKVPRDSKPGLYTGPVTVRPAGEKPVKLSLEVKVHDVELPEKWHFRNVMSWSEDKPDLVYGKTWNAELERKFLDFLLDRRIAVSTIYENTKFSPEALVSFGIRGQNVLIVAHLSPGASWAGSKAYIKKRLQEYVPPIRKAAFLDRAVVYGWDERGEDFYGEIRGGAEFLAKEYPGVRLMMAGVDTSCGTASSLAGLFNIVYCPVMHKYDPEVARRARENGNSVWWYETHWSVEQHLIRSRLIPWQTYKVRADGFLIWCINRWRGNTKPLAAAKILTDWNPFLDGCCPNSSAMYVYPGTDGPVSSLRLENFRDGIEDYELFVLAENTLARLEKAGGDTAVRTSLKKAITLDDRFVKDAKSYSADPQELLRHRLALIEALEAAGALSGGK